MSEDYVNKWAIASLTVAFWIVLGYFAYMMHYGLVKSPMDFVVLIGLPMGLLPTFAFLLSSEIQGCRKLHRSRQVCFKRFAAALCSPVHMLTTSQIFFRGIVDDLEIVFDFVTGGLALMKFFGWL